MESDTLSDTLMKMRLQSTNAGAIDAAGKWAIEFPAFRGFKLQVLLTGDRYILVEGDKKALKVNAGDWVLLTGKRPFIVASDLGIKKRIKGEDLIATKRNGVMRINGGGELLSVGIHFEFEGHLPEILFGSLPSSIHVSGHSDQAAVLRWSLDRFKAEYFNRSPGSALILNHLAPIMLLQILRVYLASTHQGNQQSWLVAISDPKMSKVFEVMHSQYQRPWSLESLAKIAGLSRSGFALSFKQKVGLSPLDYLTNWRMQIACDLLRANDHTIASVASAIGYESESAFSLAFKRIVQCRPGQYQKRSHWTKLNF